jgi:hypothetical protein
MLKKLKNQILTSIHKLNNIDNIIKDQVVIQHYNGLSLNSDKIGVTNENISDKPVIVSLTSYGLRINEVHLPIESLLNQTLKPNKILLWLDNSFKNTKLPARLIKQQERGLEIAYCEDIKSYKKLIPTLENFPNSVIITIDDDMIYSPDFVEILVNEYEKDKEQVCFFRGHTIIIRKQGKIEPYLEWVRRSASGSSLLNIPTGVGGVLYPPGVFHEDVTKTEIFMKICPYADDIWFKAMTLLKNIKCKKIETGQGIDVKFTSLDTYLNDSLNKINVASGKNDIQIKNVFEEYQIGKKLMHVYK